jgi:CRP/FNR family transcriptional regulator
MMDNQRIRSSHECATCEARLRGVFATLDGAELQRLDRAKVSHSYRRGQALFYEGNPCSAVFCVRSGLLKVYKSAPRGRQHILGLAEPGEILGFESLLTGDLHSTSSEMIEEGTVCQIGRKEVMRLLRDRADVLRSVAGFLARVVLRTQEQQTGLAGADLRERLAVVLIDFTKRFGKVTDGKVHIELRISRAELAQMLGASTEATIRQLAEFREQGLVSTTGHTIIVEDPDRVLRLSRA